MWSIPHFAIRVFFGVVGTFAIYAGLFLYEDENGKVQNKLEEWWIKLNDQQHKALSRHVAFMRMVANLTTEGYDRLFGSKLLSFQAFGVSACYSVALVVLYALVGTANKTMGEIAGETIFVLFFFALGTLPALGWNHILRTVGTISASTAPIVVVLLLAYDGQPGYQLDELLLHYLVILLVSFGFDLLFIALTRWVLRWASDVDSTFKIATIVFFNIVLAACLFVIPVKLGMSLGKRHKFTRLFSGESGKMVQVSNSIDIFAALAFVVLALLLFAHRLLWPIVNRPIYAIATSLGVRRKLFVLAGVTSFGLASGRVPDAIHKFIEIFSG